MEGLVSDNLYEILLETEPEYVLNWCETNKRFNKLCNDPNFWNVYIYSDKDRFHRLMINLAERGMERLFMRLWYEDLNVIKERRTLKESFISAIENGYDKLADKIWNIEIKSEGKIDPHPLATFFANYFWELNPEAVYDEYYTEEGWDNEKLYLVVVPFLKMVQSIKDGNKKDVKYYYKQIYNILDTPSVYLLDALLHSSSVDFLIWGLEEFRHFVFSDFKSLEDILEDEYSSIESFIKSLMEVKNFDLIDEILKISPEDRRKELIATIDRYNNALI